MCVVCVISGLIDLLPRKRVHVFGISCRKTNGMDWTQTQLGNGLGSLFIRLPTSTLWTLEKWRHEISGALGSSLHHHHKGRRHEQGHGLPQRSAPPDRHQAQPPLPTSHWSSLLLSSGCWTPGPRSLSRWWLCTCTCSTAQATSSTAHTGYVRLAEKTRKTSLFYRNATADIIISIIR